MEMADVNAYRKSDASETEKQTRASRLSARTRAKVCCVVVPLVLGWDKLRTDHLTQERLSNGSAKDSEAIVSDE